MKKPLCVILAVVLTISAMMVSATATDYIFGDANLDGRVTAADARFILRVAAELDMFESEEAFFSSDLNHDNMVTTWDARETLRLCADISPTETWTVPDEPITANIVAPPTELTTKQSNEAFTISYVNPYADGRPDIPQPSYTISPDTFVIVSYGFGHCVGMSQYGAMGMSNRGYTYLQILSHYYTGISFQVENAPQYITTEYGNCIPTYEFLCRCVMSELGGASAFPEALKAQAVASYTMLKFYNYRLPNSYTVAYSKSYSSCTNAVKNAVSAVLGTYMSYNGKAICAVYSAMSAGRTADEKDVWGTNYPYLEPVDSYDDILVSSFYPSTKFYSVVSFSSSEMKRRILSYNSNIYLSSDPANWIRVTRHDGCISEDIGYVSAMKIGDRNLNTLAGQTFRNSICGYRIRSHCFYVVYYDYNCNPHYCI